MLAFLDFISSNKLNAYPFRDESLFQGLNKDFLVDALISTDDASQNYEITTIERTASSISVIINGAYTLSATIGVGFQLVTFQGTNLFIKLLFFRTENNLPVGITNYSAGDLRFNQSTVVPISKRVTSVNGLTGDVKIKRGYNLDFDFDTDANSIEFSAIAGAGLGRPDCEEEELRPGIKLINNSSFAGTNVTFTSTECIKVINYPSDNMVALYNACDPCCKDCDVVVDEAEEDLTVDIPAQIAALDARITALEP